MEIGNFGFGNSGGGGGGGTIGGGGTLNYLAKFTPNGTTISNSLLYDNGTSVGIGTTTPDASSILDLTSTSQGFMTPRMTTVEKNAITSPATSLLLFDTTQNLFSYWDGAAWVNLNNGGIFGANNGLSISGTDVQLGGSLIQPTTISSSGANTFAVTDDIGIMIKTRDANGNFIINSIYGTPTFTNSSLIFAFTSDAGTNFTDSNIVYNFGGANNFTLAVDVFSFGDYHTFNSVFQSYNLGRANTLSSVSNAHIFGDSNNLNSCSSVNVFGNNNTINAQTNKFYIGNNNNNLVVDGSNGYVGIGTDSPSVRFQVRDGVDKNLLIYNTTFSDPLGRMVIQTVNDSVTAITPLEIVASTYYFIGYQANMWIGDSSGANPTARVHIRGTDDTSSDYALKVDNSLNSPLYHIRNDGNISFNNSVVNGTKVYLNGGLTADNTYAFRVDGDSANILNVYNNGSVGVGSISSPKFFINGTSGNVAINYASGAVSGTKFYVDGGLTASNTYALRIDGDGVGILNIQNNGLSGFGITSPLAKVHIFGGTINQRLEPVANVTEDTTGNTVNTTDNTVTAIETFSIPTDTVIMIESYVTCRKTGGAGLGVTGEGNGYIRTVKAKNVGGVVTIGVVQSSFTSEDINVFDVTFTVSGTNVLLNVTGANNDNVTWNSITKKYKVA